MLSLFAAGFAVGVLGLLVAIGWYGILYVYVIDRRTYLK